MNEQQIQDLMNALYKSQAKVVTLKGEVELLRMAVMFPLTSRAMENAPAKKGLAPEFLRKLKKACVELERFSEELAELEKRTKAIKNDTELFRDSLGFETITGKNEI
jgi:hypothetical protein